jgi:hypothetical protein
MGEDNIMNIGSQSTNLYMAYDGDNAGRMVGRAILANDEAALADASNRIALGHEIVRHWVEENGGKVISGGGDEGTFSIPSGAVDNIEQLRSDYQFTTQLTMTVGVGQTLSEAGKSLMAGKFRGKDQVVVYDATVDSDIAAAQQHVAEGQGNEEEDKLNEAYLSEQAPVAAPAKSHADDCKYCQETPDHSHTDDCQYCQASEAPSDESSPDHAHTDDCQYCAASNDLDSHNHTDDCEYCAMAEQANSDHDHTDDCQWCAAAQDHDHTDDCQYCAAKEGSTPQANALAGAIMTDDPGTQSERDQVNNIDDTQLAIGTGMEDGVSRPDGFDDSSGDPTASGPDFADVLQSGLDQHSAGINREKIVGMVSQALEGFKANKQILEQAKDQAPDLYNSTIAMLKAMIEMAKQLGFGDDVAQAEAAPQAPSAAPQEGAAPSPQQ